MLAAGEDTIGTVLLPQHIRRGRAGRREVHPRDVSLLCSTIHAPLGVGGGLFNDAIGGLERLHPGVPLGLFEGFADNSVDL